MHTLFDGSNEIQDTTTVAQQSMQTIGNPRSQICFYLPKPPLFPTYTELNSTQNSNTWQQALIDLNGNHWRKILVLIAKISAPNLQWRNYRTQLFTVQREQVQFGATQLNPHAKWHIVCGIQAAKMLGVSSAHQPKQIVVKEQVIFTPYLDYRQLPNVLVEQIRQIIHLK